MGSAGSGVLEKYAHQISGGSSRDAVTKQRFGFCTVLGHGDGDGVLGHGDVVFGIHHFTQAFQTHVQQEPDIRNRQTGHV